MLAFILSGSVRIKIYLCLEKRPCYAWEIARKKKLSVSSVYRAIKALKEKSVIRCLNPDSKRKKFYELTGEALTFKEDVEKTAY